MKLQDGKILRVLAVDFDGCLCIDAFPEVGKPCWTVINTLRDEIKNGSKVILWTCRTGEKLDEAVKACNDWGLELSAVNENLPEVIAFHNGNSRKITADEYWDDKAVFVNAAKNQISLYPRYKYK